MTDYGNFCMLARGLGVVGCLTTSYCCYLHLMYVMKVSFIKIDM